MRENRTISKEVTLIAEDLIYNDPSFKYIKDSEVKIIYLVSDATPKKDGGLKLGICELVPDKYRWAIDADFTITLFAPNVEDSELNEEQLRILVKHELMHVGLNGDKCFIVPHNVQDFYAIIEEYGVGWDAPKS